MGYDFSLWRWKDKRRIPPILCDLLLSEGIPVEEVSQIDSEYIKKIIEAGAIELEKDDCESFWDYYISSQYISVNCPFHLAKVVKDWFDKFAKKHDLYLYDSQVYHIDDNEFKIQYDKFKNIRENYFKKLEKQIDQHNLPELKDRVKKGDLKACVELGNHYYLGEIITQNLFKAFKYYKQAADHGDIDGIFNLASCYRNGEGVNKNIIKAIKLYEQIVDEDPYFTAFELGEIYINGEGIKKDLIRAAKYYNLSCSSGNSKAKKKLKEIN